MNDTATVYDTQGRKLLLGPAEHLATGGQGRVYARGDRVFKLYLDPAQALQARLPDKLAALQALAHPGIATPQDTLRDRNGEFVGITLPRVRGEALCRLFTNTWRDAHRFGTAETTAVAHAMRRIVEHAHAHQAVMVDANELNWLVQGTAPVAIDVDGWQLPDFPGQAVMTSIKDPLMAKAFTAGSDWFAWAVTSFQLWTGIHPYKGSHPDFARGALAERMAAGVSVFDARVTLPAAARPLADIPPALRAWYEAVFQHGCRCAPPDSWTATPLARSGPPAAAPFTPRAGSPQAMASPPSAALKQFHWGDAGGRVLSSLSGCLVIDDGAALRLWDAQRKQPCSWLESADVQALLSGRAALLRTPTGALACISLQPGTGLSLQTEEAPRQRQTLPSHATAMWHGANRVFALQEGVSNGLIELGLLGAGGQARLLADKTWPVNALSTRFFERCFVQDCLGSPFIGLLEGQGLLQMQAPGLQGLRVIQALGIDRHNVWLTAVRKCDGETLRLHLRAGAVQFELQSQQLVSDSALEGAVLATGLGVLRLGDGLQLVRGTLARTVDGCGLPAAARLFAIGPQLGLYQDTEVRQLSMA